MEEQIFSTEDECKQWAEKVSHTFQKTMTFTVARITESEGAFTSAY